tara:strand:- start:1593 stop:2660 length:1068 start_codon:yes stop_codon:yes gene_type:complete
LNPWTLLTAYAILAIGVSFLCSILEAVLLSTSRGHVVGMTETHPKTSNLWIGFKDDPERPLTAILTLNTIAHTVGALGVGGQVAKIYAEDTELDMIMGIASAILTLAVLLFSEILPKTIGTLYWRKLTISSGYMLRVLIISSWIIVRPVEIIRGMLPAVDTETVTRDELSVLADIAEESDIIEEDEEAVIQNLLRLRDIEIQTIMTPRVVVVHVSSEETVREVMERVPIMVYGRMPVVQGDIDNIQGMVLRSEILRKAAADEFDITMKEISRPAVICRYDDSVDFALDTLLENKSQIMVVRDDFGGTVGLVTMEDVIETLLGVEIVDEEDQVAIEEGVAREDLRELAMMRNSEEE